MAHDPKGRQMWPLLPGVRAEAEYSPDQRARFWLSRSWGRDADRVLWIGMNPSTATEKVDDPTVRREQVMTKRLGLSTMVKVNLSAYRATFPADLTDAIVAEFHEDNMRTIDEFMRTAHTIVAAWGNPPPPLAHVPALVVGMARRHHKPLLCLGTTTAGHPHHPSRLANDTPFESWSPRA